MEFAIEGFSINELTITEFTANFLRNQTERWWKWIAATIIRWVHNDPRVDPRLPPPSPLGQVIAEL